MKERLYREHHILFQMDHPPGTTKSLVAVENEERWLSAVELEELLSVLNPKIRTLFLLHHLFGYSYADLAAINKMNVKTIQKTVERARKKMLAARSQRD